MRQHFQSLSLITLTLSMISASALARPLTTEEVLSFLNQVTNAVDKEIDIQKEVLPAWKQKGEEITEVEFSGDYPQLRLFSPNVGKYLSSLFSALDAAFPHLETLHFRVQAADEDSLKSVFPKGSFMNLKTLDLRETMVMYLDPFLSLKGLRTIDLQETPFAERVANYKGSVLELETMLNTLRGPVDAEAGVPEFYAKLDGVLDHVATRTLKGEAFRADQAFNESPSVQAFEALIKSNSEDALVIGDMLDILRKMNDSNEKSEKNVITSALARVEFGAQVGFLGMDLSDTQKRNIAHNEIKESILAHIMENSKEFVLETITFE